MPWITDEWSRLKAIPISSNVACVFFRARYMATHRARTAALLLDGEHIKPTGTPVHLDTASMISCMMNVFITGDGSRPRAFQPQSQPSSPPHPHIMQSPSIASQWGHGGAYPLISSPEDPSGIVSTNLVLFIVACALTFIGASSTSLTLSMALAGQEASQSS